MRSGLDLFNRFYLKLTTTIIMNLKGGLTFVLNHENEIKLVAQLIILLFFIGRKSTKLVFHFLELR